VELFLNGASLGKREMKPNSKLTWQVSYAPGTLSAKGFDAGGKVVAETKVETTGDAAQIQLTPERSRINADGEDVAVFTVAALDAQGRIVPVAQNKINFSIEGAGKIIGVGNGDPSCHEPDTYVPKASMRQIAVNDWRWKAGEFSTRRGQATPQFAPDFDDSSWSPVNRGEMPLQENEMATYRAHVKVTREELANPGVQIHFSTIDDHGWVYVNNRRVGESHDWSAEPVFDIKGALHAGDNVIAVGVKNDGGPGGLSPDVNLEILSKAEAEPWSRSLFNGLAQIIVQSTREAGELKLSASAEGLKPATTVVQTQACTPRPAAR
jgi:beta-galactosidase